MRYEVLEKSYINDAIREPGDVVEIPETVMKSTDCGDNLKPLKPVKPTPAKTDLSDVA